MFLKVRLRFIIIYQQNCSHTASTQRFTLQGPLYNTVRTPTAEDCLGKKKSSRYKIVVLLNSSRLALIFERTYEPLPNRFAYIMARGCRNLGRYAFLCGGKSLPPNRSISNITGWNLVEPTSGEIPRLFLFQKIQKSPKRGPTFQGRVIPGKKRPLPGMHHTEVRSGDGHQNPNIQISRYPDIQISRCPDVRISRCQVSDTRYQVSGIRYQKKWVEINQNRFFQKVEKKFQRIGQIEAMTP